MRCRATRAGGAEIASSRCATSRCSAGRRCGGVAARTASRTASWRKRYPVSPGDEHQGVDRRLEVGEGLLGVRPSARARTSSVLTSIPSTASRCTSGSRPRAACRPRTPGRPPAPPAVGLPGAAGAAAARADSSSEKGSPPLIVQSRSAVLRREVRVALGEQVHRLVQGQRGEVEPRADPAGEQAGQDGWDRRSGPGARGQQEHDRRVDRAPRQVVDEAQGCLVGLVEVLDDQEQAVAGWPRAGSSSAAATNSRWWAVSPLHCSASARQRTVDLGPVGVVEPVEDGRVVPAQVRQGLEYRGIRPRALD